MFTQRPVSTFPIPEYVYSADPQVVLETVAAHKMVSLLRQVGEVSSYATEIFAALYNDAQSNFERSRHLAGRINMLDSILPQIESAMERTDPGQFYEARKPEDRFKLESPCLSSLFTRKTQTPPVQRRRRLCQQAPRLSLLDKLSKSPCMLGYSNPGLFFDYWLQEEEERQVKLQEDRQAKRVKKRNKKKAKKQIREVMQVEMKVYSAQGKEFENAPMKTTPMTTPMASPQATPMKGDDGDEYEDEMDEDELFQKRRQQAAQQQQQQQQQQAAQSMMPRGSAPAAPGVVSPGSLQMPRGSSPVASNEPGYGAPPPSPPGQPMISDDGSGALNDSVDNMQVYDENSEFQASQYQQYQDEGQQGYDEKQYEADQAAAAAAYAAAASAIPMSPPLDSTPQVAPSPLMFTPKPEQTQAGAAVSLPPAAPPVPMAPAVPAAPMAPMPPPINIPPPRQMPVRSGGLLGEITKGRQLKKAEPAPEKKADERDNLLDAIRGGAVHLKKVDHAAAKEAAKANPEQQGGLGGIMAVLARRSAIKGDDDDEVGGSDDEYEDDEWD
eukprot:gb/GEZN01004252.1/.p1 GENE.gb/GEZN01004252.1/~~gb/GEZN01004252.1/.p1  ORF type:complete len:554 (-),score=146.32 gb/GEZN01004252.1/:120-1781(-)